MKNDIELYKELVDFCNAHKDEIETKFKRVVEFVDFNILCYEKMFYVNRRTTNPPAPSVLKQSVPGLTEAYKKWSPYYLNSRNKYKKGYDIQLGQWYEKALQMFLATKDIVVKKKGFPYPDFEVSYKGRLVCYYELKYIQAPFLYAGTKIADKYPYSDRYDYEASLTLDTGEKMENQREKMEALSSEGIPVYFIWWFDCFHIKGIFAMSSSDVYSFYDHFNGSQHKRKTREGDLESHQEVGKIYPPLLNMITFSEFVKTIKKV